jgi:hypothetical protein
MNLFKKLFGRKADASIIVVPSGPPYALREQAYGALTLFKLPASFNGMTANDPELLAAILWMLDAKLKEGYVLVTTEFHLGGAIFKNPESKNE